MASPSETLAEKLYELVLSYLKHKINEGNVLYRNKDDKYFKDIEKTGGLMKMQLKDCNGDPSNPMNGKRRGIFFMANVDNRTLKPPKKSPFGSKRLKISIDYLLENFGQNGYSLFFNDFFCMNNKTNKQHYVTVVMCETGSEDFKFCQDNKLKPLPAKNGFFDLAEDGKSFRVSGHIWVEVFYMRDINIIKAKEYRGTGYEDSQMTGRGASATGLKKPPNCTICNTSRIPTGTSAGQSHQ